METRDRYKNAAESFPPDFIARKQALLKLGFRFDVTPFRVLVTYDGEMVVRDTTSAHKSPRLRLADAWLIALTAAECFNMLRVENEMESEAGDGTLRIIGNDSDEGIYNEESAA